MTPILYILMRNDMDSMNAGKAMAQASHASNAFVHQIIMNGEDAMNKCNKHWILFEEWKGETEQGYGTVIVLSVCGHRMYEAVYQAERVQNVVSGVVHDPTYPIKDGEVCHHIPLDTCGYIFGDKYDDNLMFILKGLELFE